MSSIEDNSGVQDLPKGFNLKCADGIVLYKLYKSYRTTAHQTAKTAKASFQSHLKGKRVGINLCTAVDLVTLRSDSFWKPAFQHQVQGQTRPSRGHGGCNKINGRSGLYVKVCELFHRAYPRHKRIGLPKQRLSF